MQPLAKIQHTAKRFRNARVRTNDTYANGVEMIQAGHERKVGSRGHSMFRRVEWNLGLSQLSGPCLRDMNAD
eukprot:113393-Amphidinium_carterae.1